MKEEERKRGDQGGDRGHERKRSREEGQDVKDRGKDRGVRKRKGRWMDGGREEEMQKRDRERGV